MKNCFSNGRETGYNGSMKSFEKKWYGDALSTLLQTLGGSQRVLRAQWEADGLFDALAKLTPSKDAVCEETLFACLPTMTRMAPTPKEGWLLAVFSYLQNGLYPDAAYIAPDAAQCAAFTLYTTLLSAAIAYEATLRPYDPLTDVQFCTDAERAACLVASEYDAFVRAVSDAHYLTLLRIARERMPFDPLSHTAGVHHLAVHTARQMRACGVPIDVALVCAASLSHDIGKFGCRGDDAARTPYLHYYYTDRWLKQNGLPHIAHIAANHSTWDLEYENLPAELLTLIYADFRVRGSRQPDGHERITIQSLPEAGETILHKLANVDDAKRRRYALVVQKLCDFEVYCLYLGVNPDAYSDALLPARHENAALMTDAESVNALKRLSIAHSLQLMHSVNTSASFERLLERARSEKYYETIRTYLNLFDEYFAYMTVSHKLQLLSLLYELLMHHERDVRRQAAQLMGRILANSGVQYRKDLPTLAPDTAIAPTLSEMLAQSAALWDTYLTLLLSPDPTIEKRHCLRIENSLKIVVGSVLTNCNPADVRLYLNPYLRRFSGELQGIRFTLCDSITHVPAQFYTPDELHMLLAFLEPMLFGASKNETICGLRALEYLAAHRRADVQANALALLQKTQYAAGSAESFLADALKNHLSDSPFLPPALHVSELYLDNLKTAVHWTTKEVNIDRLLAYAAVHPEEAFHIAAHLGNLLLVAEHLPVREHAANALMALSERLSTEDVNEVAIDLCRGLEGGRTESSRFLAPCLAHLARRLPAGQLDEILAMLESLVRTGSAGAAGAALSVFGAMLCDWIASNDDTPASTAVRRRIVGALMCGLAHYSDAVHRAALTVFCRDVFGNCAVPLSGRRALFMDVAKKLLTIVSERIDNDITFFNTAAMLNHLYRMILLSEVDLGAFVFAPPPDVAFFPGTFDPFSEGHKRIVTEIRKLGFTVYLAVDEFSWSKRTQPKLLRRQIALMSVADCANVYLFPDEIPINIAYPPDVARLLSLFPTRAVYLVAGSDVIENASAYAIPASEHGAASMHHILFRRNRSAETEASALARARLTGKVIELTIPPYFEDVSSSRIRDCIDQNIEVSGMIDPVAESFIREKGLYLRTPQYKRSLQPESSVYAVLDHITAQDAHRLSTLAAPFALALNGALQSGHGLAVLLSHGDAPAYGAVYGRTVNAGELFDCLTSAARTEYVRQHASGKIFLVEGCVARTANEAAELVNTLLTESLGSDHTYALYRRAPNDALLFEALTQKGFLPAGCDEVLLVDMQAPVVITLDAFMRLKEPFAYDPEVTACVYHARKRLLGALCDTFPGTLILGFDAARINHALVEKVLRYNGVWGLPEQPRKLGPYMCVPYSKTMSDIVAPNTVTKALHVEKVFAEDMRHFTIEESAGYSPLVNQLAVIRSFHRPVLLVDDLLHNGYRIEKLSPLFAKAGIQVEKILVGVLSGRGKDLMQTQSRDVDAVYWVPNLRYWFTESLLYPFIGGDSVRRADASANATLPSINLIWPYQSPNFLRDVSPAKRRALSETALSNTYDILHTLEQRYRMLYHRSMTLARLGEALLCPMLPDRGRAVGYDGSVSASTYVQDDIDRMKRLSEEV